MKLLAEGVPYFDNRQAEREGWSIFHCAGSDGPQFQLQRCDEAEIFPDDITAWRHVAERARDGIKYHRAALDWLQQNCRAEWEDIAATFGLRPYYHG